jgi:spindle assembly abnormal protein 6
MELAPIFIGVSPTTQLGEMADTTQDLQELGCIELRNDNSVDIVYQEQVPIWIFKSTRGLSEGNRILVTLQLSTHISCPQLISSNTAQFSSFGNEEQHYKGSYTSAILKTKTLNVRLTNEKDLFFLYTVSIDEEGFSKLKKELNLNFDYHSVESKLIHLIEQCNAAEREIAASSSHTASAFEKYQLKLILPSTNSAEGELRFVKNDSFREIPIFTLQVRPGNDRAIKQFLADEVMRLKSENQKLSQNSSHTEQILRQRLGKSEAELESLRSKLSDITTSYERQLNDLKLENQNMVSKLKESSLIEKENLYRQHTQEKLSLEEKYSKQVQELRERCDLLANENKVLMDRKCELESENRHLSNSQIKDKDQSQMQILSFKEKIIDKEKMLEQTQAALDEAKVRCHDLEKQVSTHEHDMQRQQEKYEVQAELLRKANEIVVKLDAKIQLNKQESKEQKRKLIHSEQTIRKLNNKLVKLEHKLLNQNDKYQEKLKELKEEIEYKEQEKEQLKEKIERFQEQNKLFQEENNRLQRVLSDLIQKEEKKHQHQAENRFSSSINNPTSPPFKSYSISPTKSGFSPIGNTLMSSLTVTGNSMRNNSKVIDKEDLSYVPYNEHFKKQRGSPTHKEKDKYIGYHRAEATEAITTEAVTPKVPSPTNNSENGSPSTKHPVMFNQSLNNPSKFS